MNDKLLELINAIKINRTEGEKLKEEYRCVKESLNEETRKMILDFLGVSVKVYFSIGDDYPWKLYLDENLDVFEEDIEKSSITLGYLLLNKEKIVRG